MAELNEGLIYTNENCIGCNRCIYSCPVIGANVSKISNGNNKIYVDGDKCIHCGKCIDTCRHNARQYRDDVDLFLDDLENGADIALIVDTTFFNDYADEYDTILGYLQSKGVKTIYDTALGADIVTWCYIKYLNDNRFEGAISEPCPAIVNYIVKYKQELIKKIIPVHSPLLCTAIYARKYLNDKTTKFAYIGPCIAKKDEITSIDTKGIVSYSITIEKLVEALKDKINGNYKADIYKSECGLGVSFPEAGGLTENIVHFQGHGEIIRKVDGCSQSYAYIDEYANRIKEGKQLPFLIDILNCKNGCLFGTGVDIHGEKKEEAMYNIHSKKINSTPIYDDGESPYSRVISREDRKIRLYKKYEDLNIDDFLREFTVPTCDKEDEIEYDEDAIFDSMYKFSEEDRCIDCHSCGYDSCREMVRAIAHGYNFKKNCVHYVKEENLRLYMSDTLSGIPNTNAFTERCNEIIKAGNANEYFAIYFNIKNMKLINRKYGSKTGDVILADYARYVNRIANGDEIVARWGGDNFVAMFKKEREKEVLNCLENVVIRVSRPEGDEDCKINFRAAIYNLTGQEKIAGQVMGQITTTYSAIKQSKHHILYFTEELAKKILHNTVIEDLLEPALKNNEFLVYYQPKVRMEDNNLIGAEALVRWFHDGQIIPPIEFIPICENNGFVQQIDFYVLEKVCQDMREWLDKGIGLVKISFNFSKQHFTERNVAKRIDDIADKYGIPREYLEVEFTETAYIEEYDNLIKTIEELREYNICSSIDDFGTGYSSLSLLQNVRFHTLKLDKSFLNKLEGNDKRNRTVIASIIRMAKELDMDIVAEGIETNDEFNYLREMSCDVAQGYLFDKPLPKVDFEKRLLCKHYSNGNEDGTLGNVENK